jgi:hypothetical protein
MQIQRQVKNKWVANQIYWALNENFFKNISKIKNGALLQTMSSDLATQKIMGELTSDLRSYLSYNTCYM